MRLNQFVCLAAVIVVSAACDTDSPAAPTPLPVDVQIAATGAGSVRSDGFVSMEARAGDGALDRAHEAFFEFDLSLIPPGSSIDAFSIDFSGYTLLNNPFAWGCLTGTVVDAFPLDSGDFSNSLVASGDRLFDYCSTNALDAANLTQDRLRDAVQARVGGSLELRLQVEHGMFMGAMSDSDGVADQIQFSTPRLQITYTAPQ